MYQKPQISIRQLTNRFHVAVRLFSNRSERTSKFGKNKKVAHKAIAECVTDVLTTFWRLLWSITEQTHGNMESILFYIIQKQTITEEAFLIQNLSTWLESRPLPTPPTLTNTKKAIWRHLLSKQMKQPHWLLCVAKEFWLVQENYATVKLDSSGTSHGVSRIELWNLQIVKKMLEK